ncbi:hypothetical protein BXY64_2875 [Marinifilum flexuosum]|uniref:Uncharacterized protein n=1 Tax=Marinifilum flexuosum TaxID=1117708 RepID=A0A419WWM2_9BACT|nr:hypothetical protein BXY64_2875 [Marinifilum flexuosum]
MITCSFLKFLNAGAHYFIKYLKKCEISYFRAQKWAVTSRPKTTT